MQYTSALWGKLSTTLLYSRSRYNIMFTLVTYVVPMLQMLISYTHMGIVLWSKDGCRGGGSGVNAEETAASPQAAARRDSYVAQQRERAIMSKRKVRKG